MTSSSTSDWWDYPEKGKPTKCYVAFKMVDGQWRPEAGCALKDVEKSRRRLYNMLIESHGVKREE